MHSEDAFGSETERRVIVSEDEKPGRWMNVQEAAAVLGIQGRSVQKRAQAGSLQSKRNGRRLFVWIEDANSSQKGSEVPNSDAKEGEGLLVEQLRSENTFLREQLEQGRQAESEFRRLMAHSQEQSRADRREIEQLRQRLAITAGEGSEEKAEAEPATVPATGRTWWAFWRREN